MSPIRAADLVAEFRGETRDFDRATTKVDSTIARLAGIDPQVNVGAHVAEGMAGIGQVAAAAEALDSQPVNVDVDVQTAGAMGKVAALEGAFSAMSSGGAKAFGALGGVAALGAAAVGTAAVGIGVGLGALAVSSVNLASEFEKTMNTMAAVAGVPGPELEQLRQLSMQLGADTVFSANEAAAGMLELSKAGISTADIMGGALANTLDLATAGDLELADAATVAANAMNIFGLNGADSKQVADALAGAANASSANVSDLALALSQGGSAAAMAGLTVQETAGFLGLLAQKGIQGSDAGTSLKTALLNLVPTTGKAKDMMNELGISFVDSEGNIVSLLEMQEELQSGLGHLTQAEQQAALKTMFGTDAYRAMGIMLNSTEEEMRGFIGASSDAGAASDVAAGKMQGLPGALERLSGAWETARLQVGQGLAPAVSNTADLLGAAIGPLADDLAPAISGIIGALTPAIGPVISLLGSLVTAFTPVLEVVAKVAGELATALAPAIEAAAPDLATLAVSFGDFLIALIPLLPAIQELAFAALPLFNALVPLATVIAQALVPAITTLMGWLEPLMPVISGLALAFLGVPGIIGAVTAALGFILSPIGLVVGAIVGLIAIGVAVYENWDKIKSAASTVWNFVGDLVGSVINKVKEIIGGAVDFLSEKWNQITAAVDAAWVAVRTIVTDAISGAVDAVTSAVGGVIGFLSDAWNGIRDTASSAWNAVVDTVGGAIGGVIDRVRELPGQIIDALANAGSWLLDAGRNIVEGLWNGVSGAMGWLKGKWNSFIEMLPGDFANDLKIASPSRVFEELGREIPAGVVQGLMAGLPEVERMLHALTSLIAATQIYNEVQFVSQRASLAASGSGAFQGGGSGPYFAPGAIVIQGSVIAERDFAAMVAHIVAEAQRRGAVY